VPKSTLQQRRFKQYEQALPRRNFTSAISAQIRAKMHFRQQKQTKKNQQLKNTVKKTSRKKLVLPKKWHF